MNMICFSSCRLSLHRIGHLVKKHCARDIDLYYCIVIIYLDLVFVLKSWQNARKEEKKLKSHWNRLKQQVKILRSYIIQHTFGLLTVLHIVCSWIMEWLARQHLSFELCNSAVWCWQILCCSLTNCIRHFCLSVNIKACSGRSVKVTIENRWLLT